MAKSMNYSFLILTIILNPSLAGQIKKFNGPRLAPGPWFAQTIIDQTSANVFYQILPIVHIQKMLCKLK